MPGVFVLYSANVDTEAKIKAHRRAGFAPEAGRALSQQEWLKLREWLSKNPEARLCRNEMYNSKCFFQYNAKSKAGMFWAPQSKMQWYRERKRKTTNNALRAFEKVARQGFDSRFKKWAHRNAYGARSRGIANDLMVGELKELYGASCFYCGRAPEENSSWGIDRLHNNIGYHYDNCVSCCAMCNRAKGTTGFEEFVQHIQKIAANIGRATPIQNQ
jgi:hypothetical protein